MVEYKSIKVNDTTFRWIRRLKGIIEHSTAEPFTMDVLLMILVANADYKISQSLGLTIPNESMPDYVKRINEKLEIIETQNQIEELDSLVDSMK